MRHSASFDGDKRVDIQDTTGQGVYSYMYLAACLHVWCTAADTGQHHLCCLVEPSTATGCVCVCWPDVQVKKTTFNNSPPDRLYGTILPPDAEGARAGGSLLHVSTSPRA